jgi:glucose/arabinose dehydrogenase
MIDGNRREREETVSNMTVRKSFLALELLALLACTDAPASDTRSGGASDSLAVVPQQSATGIRLEQVAGGFNAPLYLAAPSGDTRSFVVEQGGRVRIIKGSSVIPIPFLDISDRISSGGERGLLSIAFHPRYTENGYFYVDFTDPNGDTRIERMHADPKSDRADGAPGKLLLTIKQPYANHNGGLVMFGPDGMLYIGMGDGGSGGDPHGNGQNRNVLLGKILRIDVDHGDPYAIPATNPFANGGGAKEIWSYGMRNPWRFSFDSPSGLLITGDVGQNAWEEIDAVSASAAGLNYGWNRIEGTHCYGASTCSKSGITLPLIEYGHSDGCSVTGGYVYRGKAIPSLAGTYFYSDYCQGWLRSARFVNGRATELRKWAVTSPGPVTSFGVDGAGELYVIASSGIVYRIAAVR